MVDVAVDVKQGRLIAAADSSEDLVIFRGVPYAEPPVGDLRWKAPQPPAAWSEPRSSDNYGPSAPQHPVLPDSIYSGVEVPSDEDCLYLNIWTPTTSPDTALPVFVVLHFGAFQFGAGTDRRYNGADLAKKGAVVITINYRLGVLGFLAHPELSAESPHGSSGNYGLLDQIAALHWVKANASAFGGDINNITVMGVSAGSASISLLMVSPLARGLFDRAIAMSGGLLGPVGTSSGYGDRVQGLSAAEQSGVQFASLVGAEDLAQLRARPWSELQATLAVESPSWRLKMGGDVEIGLGAFDGVYPIVDGWVVPGSPYTLWSQGEQAPVPLLTGSAADECAGLPRLVTSDEYDRYLADDFGPMAPQVREAFSHLDIESASSRTLADRIFIWQNYTMARHHSARFTTFYYHSSFTAPIPPSKIEHNAGAVHAGEIPFVFDSLDDIGWAPAEADRARVEQIQDAWLNFARHGNPNGANHDDWPKFDQAKPTTMHFEDSGATLGDVPRRAVMDLWDEYFAHADQSRGS